MPAYLSRPILAAIALAGVGGALVLGLSGTGLVMLWLAMACAALTLRAFRSMVDQPVAIPVPVRVEQRKEQPQNRR